MKECIICGEKAVYNRIDYCLCDYCLANIPMGLVYVRIGARKDWKVSANHIGIIPPENVGFTFTQDNWMLFTTVVKRMMDLGRPIHIKLDTDLEYVVVKTVPKHHKVHFRPPGRPLILIADMSMITSIITMSTSKQITNSNSGNAVCLNCNSPGYLGLERFECFNNCNNPMCKTM